MHKIVVHTYLLLVQHLFKAADDKFFQFITRRYITSVLQCWFWQPSPIHLAIGCQGQGIHLEISRRHHVVRKRLREVVAQGRLVNVAISRVIETQSIAARHLFDNSYSPTDSFKLGGTGFYLVQFDAVATQFCLVVGATNVFQITISVPAA